MQSMAVRGWLSSVVALLSATFVIAHEHMKTNTHHVSVGYLFVLKCQLGLTNVTWSREGTHNQSLPAGVEAREALLLFQPVQMSHNGSYACERRGETELKVTFSVLVSREKCPEPVETRSISQEVVDGLPCKMRDIFRLNNSRNVRWMKDCHPVKRQGKRIVMNERGFLTLPAASVEDAGKYTCLVDVMLDGKSYTAARSIQLVIKSEPPDLFSKLQVLYPQEDVVTVEVGMRAELRCLAHIGVVKDKEVSMYWTFNAAHIDDYMEFNESWRFVQNRRQVNGESTLSISKVRREFLNVPFQCHVVSPADREIGLLYLQEADRSGLLIAVALCLFASLFTLALAAVFLFCKSDLVLAYRNLVGFFTKQEAPGGKLYDAYVSHLHPNSRSNKAAVFALQILPEKLETQHGYSLYIRGRDDSAGEAVHDVIATTVRQCQRVIIIMSADDDDELSVVGNNEEELLRDQSQLHYEQSISLYDALLLNDPKVILVEIGPVDYSGLPESLRYIKRKQGSLIWRRSSPGATSLSKLYLNRNFWKDLRYSMPSVRVRKPQIKV